VTAEQFQQLLGVLDRIRAALERRPRRGSRRRSARPWARVFCATELIEFAEAGSWG
jgi:hypothetical protein